MTEPTEDERKVALAAKLTVLTRHLWLKFDQSVEKKGVTRAKWTLMAAVSRHPGATQRAIATILQVTDVTAGRLIDSLCADGYLERLENPDDRRSYRVYLTPAAQPGLDLLRDLGTIHAREAFAGFADDDLAKFESLLDAISRNIEDSRDRQ
jgi:MarR family transcriptional regulator, transcriptional regulator for hemolysin